jgi:hypothetical protein
MSADKDIKLVDLSKENLNTVKEAIRIGSALGATDFRFYVNPSFVKNGLVITKIVPLITEPPPKSQMLLNFMGLKNLKKTLDFAKSILGETGEVEVEERYEPVVHAEKEAEEASVVAAQVIAAEEEVSDTAPEETQEEVLAAEKEADEAPKKRKSKKSQDVSAEESE